jgi:small subunit ribosomal protein S1
MMFMRDRQREKKLASRVERPLPLDERTPLSALIPGMSEVPGVVISLTPFGAYVDIGTEVDGLLHVSQMSATEFISHPRQILAPGDAVEVSIRALSVDRKKLQLSMLPQDVLERERQDALEVEDRIPLAGIQVDDELWGEVKRVTNFGAYIEVGAAVDGFMHFMDHPEYDSYQHPTEFMSKGDRVRVWVSDVDLERSRIKLTAVRPSHLPGPRSELYF